MDKQYLQLLCLFLYTLLAVRKHSYAHYNDYTILDLFIHFSKEISSDPISNPTTSTESKDRKYFQHRNMNTFLTFN